MKKKSVILGFAAIVLAACAPATPTLPQTHELAEPVPYQSRFASFDIPGNWQSLGDAGSYADQFEQLLFVPEGVSIEDASSGVFVEIINSWAPRVNFAEVEDVFTAFLENEMLGRPGATLLGLSSFETNFGEAIEVLIEDEIGGQDVTQLNFYLLVDNFQVMIMANNYGDGVPVEEVARGIVDSIEFMDLLLPRENPGEWDGNIFYNEFLGFRFELPPGWEVFTREIVAGVLGPEAEQNVELMAYNAALTDTEYNELLQVFLAEYEPGQTLEGFLLHQAEVAEADSVVSGDISEVVLADETYVHIINTIDLGENVMVQYNFVRMVNPYSILVISLMHTDGMEADVVGFLEAALAAE